MREWPVSGSRSAALQQGLDVSIGPFSSIDIRGGERTFAATSNSYKEIPKADICDDLKAANLSKSFGSLAQSAQRRDSRRLG